MKLKELRILNDLEVFLVTMVCIRLIFFYEKNSRLYIEKGLGNWKIG